jgi:murein DD-endopeptidase MepM/ murein hydrolase activator NlpD
MSQRTPCILINSIPFETKTVPDPEIKPAYYSQSGRSCHGIFQNYYVVLLNCYGKVSGSQTLPDLSPLLQSSHPANHYPFGRWSHDPIPAALTMLREGLNTAASQPPGHVYPACTAYFSGYFRVAAEAAFYFNNSDKFSPFLQKNRDLPQRYGAAPAGVYSRTWEPASERLYTQMVCVRQPYLQLIFSVYNIPWRRYEKDYFVCLDRFPFFRLPVCYTRPNLTDTPAPTPTPTCTPTLTPTSTPEISTINGILYWELNPDGYRNLATFSYPEFTDKVFYYLLSFFPDLNSKAGDILSVMEPVLPGFQVCAVIVENEFCDTTDNDGKFLIDNIPVKNDTLIYLRINDPNENDLSKAMKYIFVDKEPTLISANIQVKANHDFSIGLAQGFLILPFSSTLKYQPYVFEYTDIDLEIGKRIDWTGNSFALDPASIDPYVWNKSKYGVYDQHQGTDWAMPIGTDVTAMFPGKVFNSEGGYPLDYARYVRTVVNIPTDPVVYLLTYGHTSENKVDVNEIVSYSELLALSGNDAGRIISNPHLHVSFWTVPREEIWNPYHTLPELGDYLFGRSKFSGNGNAVRYVQGYDVARDYCPFAHYMFTGGNIPIYPDSPPK